jgi:hypothetical protein
MRKLGLVAALAAAVLVVGPMLMALAAEGDAGGAGGKGGRGGMKGGFGAPVTVTDEQAATLKPAVEAVTTAAKALQTEAVKALGEQDGPRFTMQTIRAAMTAAFPPPAAAEGDKAGKGKGGFGGTPITPTEEQLKTLKAPVDAATKAVKDLAALAVKTLKDEDGRRYTMQTVMQVGRDLNPNAMGPGGGKEGGKGKGKGKGKGGDAAPAAN